VRQIIRCPDCEVNGEKQNLAEVLPTGFISIQRIRRGSVNGDYKDFTIVSGNNLSIICGGCGNVVYRKGE